MATKKTSTSSIDFSALISDEQKRQVIEGRIQQFAAEAYQHTLNKQTAENIKAKEQVEAAEKSIAILEAAIKVHLQELSKLPAPTPPPTQE
jgi:hypothetical protein